MHIHNCTQVTRCCCSTPTKLASAWFTRPLANVAMLGDATEEFTLHSAGINRCDALIATTGDDAVNLAACQLAKFTFGVETVVSIVNDSADTNLFLTAGSRFHHQPHGHHLGQSSRYIA